jgi:DNA primase
MTKAKRTGKIFIDYFRNDYTATAIADYGVRARPGAPAAVPLHGMNLMDSRRPAPSRSRRSSSGNRKPPGPPKGQVLPAR